VKYGNWQLLITDGYPDRAIKQPGEGVMMMVQLNKAGDENMFGEVRVYYWGVLK